MYNEDVFISDTSSFPKTVVVEYYRDDHNNKLVKSICTKYGLYDDVETNDKKVLNLDADEYLIGCCWTIIQPIGKDEAFEENEIGFKTSKREINYYSDGFKCNEGRMIVGFYSGILDGFIRKIGFYTIPCHENPIIKEKSSYNYSRCCSIA